MRLTETHTEKGGFCAIEMNPVNRPRILSLTAISMCLIFGQNEKLVSPNVIALTVQFEPSLPLYTINQHKLIGILLFPLTIMKTSMRIITDIRDVKLAAQRVALQLFYQKSRQDNYPFSLESFLYPWHGL